MKYTRVETVMEKLKARFPGAYFSHISRGTVETAGEEKRSLTSPVVKRSRRLLGFLGEVSRYGVSE